MKDIINRNTQVTKSQKRGRKKRKKTHTQFAKSQNMEEIKMKNREITKHGRNNKQKHTNYEITKMEEVTNKNTQITKR